MNKTRLIILIIIFIFLSAVSLGICMAYKTYKAPMEVENLKKALEILTSEATDGEDLMIKLAMYNELNKSKVMIDRHSSEKKKFSEIEMKEIYNNIGGKEAVINYLESISDDGERRDKLKLASDLKIISREELNDLW